LGSGFYSGGVVDAEVGHVLAQVGGGLGEGLRLGERNAVHQLRPGPCARERQLGGLEEAGEEGAGGGGGGCALSEEMEVGMGDGDGAAVGTAAGMTVVGRTGGEGSAMACDISLAVASSACSRALPGASSLLQNGGRDSGDRCRSKMGQNTVNFAEMAAHSAKGIL
jgi:hypothetical protein